MAPKLDSKKTQILTSSPCSPPIKLPRPNIHRRLPPLNQRQPRVHRPPIPRPIRMQINPKQRIPTPRHEPRPPLLLIPSPLPLPKGLNLHIRKPGLAPFRSALSSLEIDEEARHAVEPSTVLAYASHGLRLVVPVVVDVELLAFLVAHELRGAEVAVGREEGAHEGLSAREDALDEG
jgi:hypothetical protein